MQLNRSQQKYDLLGGDGMRVDGGGGGGAEGDLLRAGNAGDESLDDLPVGVTAAARRSR